MAGRYEAGHDGVSSAPANPASFSDMDTPGPLVADRSIREQL
jgi:hypothetical protein